MFGCYDTTTVIMDFLNKSDCKIITQLDKNFYKIKNNRYYKIRILQCFIRNINRKLKCFFNDQYCKKITFKQLENNIDKYVGKTIQFILKSPFKTKFICEKYHYTLWECKLKYRDNNYFKDIKGINTSHNGRINFNILNKCDCESRISIFAKTPIETFFGYYNIFEFSLRVII